MTKIHNKSYLKNLRKKLRNNATDAEKRLWLFLKNKQLKGRKFTRQHSIGNYIVDFYCYEERIIIELDGEHHFEEDQKIYDKERTQYFEMLGFRVIRFRNVEVLFDTDKILRKIENEIL